MRLLCRFLIFIFRLNGKTIFSNEFIQMLNPLVSVKFDSVVYRFRTGNGRLLWRAKGLLEEEPLMISWVRSMVPNDVVLDIGANVGMYSILIANRTKMVYSCELDPLNIAILKENIHLNGLLEKVKIIPLACGLKTEMVSVKFRSLSYGDALQLIEGGDEKQYSGSHLEKSAHSFSVLQGSLDILFEDANLVKPNKIKIDVDGNELAILGGARGLISEANEVYFEDGITADCDEFMKFLTETGFLEVSRVEQFSKNKENELAGYTKIFRKER